MANQYYQQLVQRFTRLHHLNHGLTFLSWDQSVMMPEQGNSARAAATAELSSFRHELLTDAVVEEWLKHTQEEALTSPELKNLQEMSRQWQQASCLPAELVQAQALAGSKCEHAWRTQRGDNDWKGFLANFKEVLALSREEAQLRQAANKESFTTPYDAMLDLYCRGDSSEFISQIFSRIKSELPTLIQAVIESQKSRPSVTIVGNFDQQQQHALNKTLASVLGFDFKAGRLDISTHPFSTGVRGDHRICTRYADDEFIQALLATAHETGHASYEAGLPEAWDGMPVGESLSMCIHESQSLLFEKQLFLSKPFLQFFINTIHQQLPVTKAINGEQLWQHCTQVKPDYIRVEADEVTYPMHIVLRYEIESALVNGGIEAEHIPELWNQKMQEYLGVDTKGNYKDGCMQDIHWTYGAFGYFPSYTIGALNAAQLFHSIKAQTLDWQDQLGKGDIQFIRQWLAEHIWQQGNFLSSQALMKAATGEETNPDFFLKHVRERYLNEQY